MTLGDIVSDVRKLVNDEVVEYRWPTADIAGYLRDSVERLHAVRPASRYVNGVIADTAWPDDVTTYTLPDELVRWKLAFVYYAAARCLELDAADTVNQSLAVDFMSKAEARFLV